MKLKSRTFRKRHHLQLDLEYKQITDNNSNCRGRLTSSNSDRTDFSTTIPALAQAIPTLQLSGLTNPQDLALYLDHNQITRYYWAVRTHEPDAVPVSLVQQWQIIFQTLGYG